MNSRSVEHSKFRENKSLVDELRSSEFVVEKQQVGTNICSFNFKKKALYKKIWNRQTTRARGLFLNTNTFEIVARSYEKFFNIGEMDISEFEYLQDNFSYPVKVFKKENGFLGILGYDSQTDELVFATKSMITGDYVSWFKEIFLHQFEKLQGEIKTFLKNENISLVFEVIDPKNDPHIIEYESKEIVLLDAIYRTASFRKYAWEDLVLLSKNFGFYLKELEKLIHNAEEFEKFYLLHQKSSESEEKHEGFVLEDKNLNMVKIKLPYYTFWKEVRKYIELYSFNPNTRIKQEYLKNDLFMNFWNWYLKNYKSLEGLSLIEIRKEYLDQD